jgi:methylmalonyl-CoA mutase N-terminal domain/subunit
MEKGAYDYFKKIDNLGGMVKAIEHGFPQREIMDHAYWFQQAVDKAEKTIVGVNKYVMHEEITIPLLRIDPEVEKKQITRTNEVRRARDNKAWENSLRELKKAASGKDNLMPYIYQAVKAYATIGEIVDAMKEVFGVYREPAMF